MTGSSHQHLSRADNLLLLKCGPTARRACRRLGSCASRGWLGELQRLDLQELLQAILAQLAPVAGVMGWRLDAAAMAEIDRILDATISDPVGPEFMAPPDRLAA